MVTGIDKGAVTGDRIAGAVCRPCGEGKLSHAPFSTSKTNTAPMDLMHSDISGPLPKSPDGSRFFATLFEQASTVILAVPIANKSDVGSRILANVPELERLGGGRLRCLRTDGAKEYATKRLADWCTWREVKHENTLPYNPESNGVAERVNRTIKERAR